MGTANFERIGFGTDFQKAYGQANGTALSELGHQDGYSGDLNSCDPPTRVVAPSRWGTKKTSDWMWDKMNNGGKRDAWGFEITGKAAVDLKKANGYAGTHKKPFVFFGNAPD